MLRFPVGIAMLRHIRGVTTAIIADLALQGLCARVGSLMCFESGFVCGHVIALRAGEVSVLQVAAHVVHELGLVVEVVVAEAAGAHGVVRVGVEVSDQLAALVELELSSAVAPLADQVQSFVLAELLHVDVIDVLLQVIGIAKAFAAHVAWRDFPFADVVTRSGFSWAHLEHLLNVSSTAVFVIR